MIGNWQTRNHPARVAFRDRMSQPIVGMHKRKSSAGCYGVCCNEHTGGGYVCTVCHKYSSHEQHCCGYHTVSANPRIEVPPMHSKGRWKAFVKRFPRFRNRPELRCDGSCEKHEGNMSATRGDQ